ncbi:hypothetical protein, partial [Ruegeria lacuscaerulensis]|uniref:hypothetical protein n=1 Tax=Ruegeria lacuscaerulensis TaxID=55218 RepID=UPI001BE3D387
KTMRRFGLTAECNKSYSALCGRWSLVGAAPQHFELRSVCYGDLCRRPAEPGTATPLFKAALRGVKQKMEWGPCRNCTKQAFDKVEARVALK